MVKVEGNRLSLIAIQPLPWCKRGVAEYVQALLPLMLMTEGVTRGVFPGDSRVQVDAERLTCLIDTWGETRRGSADLGFPAIDKHSIAAKREPIAVCLHEHINDHCARYNKFS